MRTPTIPSDENVAKLGFILQAAAVALLTVVLAPLALMGLSFLAGGSLPMMILCAQLFTPTALVPVAALACGGFALAGAGAAVRYSR